MTDRIDGSSRAKGEAPKIEPGEAQIRDQFLQVADEDVRRIICRIVRLAALPVGAKIRHDHPGAFACDPPRMTELDPVHLRIGKQAMQQDDGCTGANFMERQFDPVGGGPFLSKRINHLQRECQSIWDIATGTAFQAFGTRYEGRWKIIR